MKLEEFLLSQLYILGAVGIGIAFLQVRHLPVSRIHNMSMDISSNVVQNVVPVCSVCTNQFLMSFFLSACGDDVYLLPLSKFGGRSVLIFDILQYHKLTQSRHRL